MGTIIAFCVLFVCVAVNFVSNIVFIVRVFATSVGAGLGCLFIPFFALVYALVNSDRFKGYLITQVLTCVVGLAAAFFAQESLLAWIKGAEQNSSVSETQDEPRPRKKQYEDEIFDSRDIGKSDEPRPSKTGEKRAPTKGTEKRPVAKGGDDRRLPPAKSGDDRRFAAPSNPSDVGTLTVPELIEQLKDKSKDVRTRAIFELGKRGKDAADALPLLKELVDDPDVGLPAKFAVKKIENP